MPTESEMRSRRDSWPPTQVCLKPTVSTKNDPLPSLDDIDEDPLTYFLTPAPDIEDDDVNHEMMDFDAGIEDSKHPREAVRSVSPSTLDGLRKPGLRPISPDISSEMAAPDDDDEEDYIRFSTNKHGLLSLREIFAHGDADDRPNSPLFGESTNFHLAPTSPQPRGRAQGRGGLSARRRAGQLWREPSPDVWSIEEETEEELMSDVGSSVAARSDVDSEHGGGVKLFEKKKMKRVRFVLPAKVN